MLLPLLLGLIFQGPPEIALDARSVLMASETKAVLRIRAGDAALEGRLQLWCPPDLRVLGLDPVVSLAAGEVLIRKLVLVVETGRPAGVLEMSVELLDSAGARLLRHDHQLWSANGRDLLRLPFETRRSVPETKGDVVVSLTAEQVASGAGALRLTLDANKAGSATLWELAQGHAPIANFPYVSFYLRTPACRALSLQFMGENGSSILPVIGGESAAVHVSGDDRWQRVVIPIDPTILEPQSIRLTMQGSAEETRVDIDEFVVSRRFEPTAGDRLRHLTERFVGARPESDSEVTAMQAGLAKIAFAELSTEGRIDHDLLDHALAFRASELRFVPKEPGQPADEERFAALLKHRHHLDLDADQVRQLGYAEVARHQKLLSDLGKEISPGESWRQVVELLKQRHTSAEQLPAFAEQAMQAAIRFSVEHELLTVPMAARNARIEVVTDGRRSRTYPFGGYGGARRTPEGYIGTYFVSPPAVWMNAEQSRDRLRGNHRAWTRVVALHEIVPGHHLQTVVHRMRPLSAFRRQFYSTVFAEGWALYCEEMLFREGFFPDADTRFTQLHMRLWRAARMVIDASLHTGKMSLDEAQSFLVDEVAFDPINARAEVLRYVDNPSRPMSYMLGFIMLTQLIEDARQAAGEDFVIADFRDRLLSFGPIPIPAIRLGLGL